MLDFDLSEMYGLETFQLKRSVRRHIECFEGDDFMYEVTKDEWDSLRCQIGILNEGRGQHRKYLPFAFTELGVSMLSSVLNTPTAIQINRGIIRAFVQIRQYILTPAPTESLSDRMDKLEECINDILTDQNEINEDTRMQLELINETLATMQTKSSNCNPIGYEAASKNYKNKK